MQKLREDLKKTVIFDETTRARMIRADEHALWETAHMTEEIMNFITE